VASSRATGCEVIAGPRSAWMVSWSGAAISPLAKGGTLVAAQHPADDVAAEDVEQHVEVVVGPLDRAEELGDVPAPDLVGPGGEQLRFPIHGVSELGAALTHLGVRRQHPASTDTRAGGPPKMRRSRPSASGPPLRPRPRDGGPPLRAIALPAAACSPQ
jgi:hypothetical protein